MDRFSITISEMVDDKYTVECIERFLRGRKISRYAFMRILEIVKACVYDDSYFDHEIMMTEREKAEMEMKTIKLRIDSEANTEFIYGPLKIGEMKIEKDDEFIERKELEL